MEFRRVLFRSSGGRGKGHGVHPYSCSGSMLVDLGRAIRSAAVVDLSRLAARSGETRATCGMFWVSTAGWATDQGRRRVEVIWLSPVAARSQSISTTVTVDRKSTRLNSSHVAISYAVFCLKKKNIISSESVR